MTRRVLGTAAALSLVLAAAAGTASTAAAVGPAAGWPETPKKYIVQTESTAVTGGVATDVRREGGAVADVYSEAFSGFSATMTAAQVRILRSDHRVRSVTRDAVVHSTATQTNPTWGLDRIDQRAMTGNHLYRYDTTGRTVTAFVVDTGVRLGHSQFGGRVTSGYDFVDGDTNASDCQGHGTHVAGTIGGSTYGAAKAVKVVALRVLDCQGAGYFSDSIEALDWIIAHKPPGPSVVNMSLGGAAYPPVDEAVERTVAAGIPVVVSAGNNGGDACDQSPARAPRAVTVAATDSSDLRPGFSNFGRCVDLFAPGVGVRSASNDSTTATAVLSGTSMSAPHVTAVVARHLQRLPKATPAQVATALTATATPNAVRDSKGSPNRLLHVALQPVTAPGLPTSVVASRSDTSRTGTLRWASPAFNGGRTITGYRVSRSGTDATGAGPQTVLVSAAARSHTFSKLRGATSYTLSVRAVNSVGTGAAVSRTITLAK